MNFCVFEYNVLKIHKPPLQALFGVRCGVKQQLPDQVPHVGQHTCSSVSLMVSQLDVQVLTVMY